MQLDEMVVTRPEQARALQDTGFLGRFLEPASPSDVARSLGMKAALAHHHARRHAALGLLNVVKRDGGRVYYQLAARMFRHERSLLPVGDPDEQTAVALELLRQRFLAEYEACDRAIAGAKPDWHVYEFGRRHRGVEPDTSVPFAPGPARPAHFQAHTLSLSPDRYQALVRKLARLIQEVEADEDPQTGTCTFALITMSGVLQSGNEESQYTSSFVPLDGESATS